MDEARLREAAEAFLRGLYEEGAPLETLLADADTMEFSWIGTAGKEVFDSVEPLLRYEKRTWPEGRPRQALQMLDLSTYPVGPGLLCVTARFRLTREGKEEERRATLLYLERGRRTSLVHVHLSGPWMAEGGREPFPLIEGRANYEYVRQMEQLHRDQPAPALTAKQRRVLAYLVEGRTYQEIGELMSISHRTVRYYVTELIHRFRVENRAQLITAASRLLREERED